MLSVEVKNLSPQEVYYYMIGGIGPRPIALVSTISSAGNNNLAPFSFFNGFGSNPPMIGFSPARRGRDATFKDTYNNLMATKECVVQVVTYSIVDQVNLASTEFPSNIDEFIKSGLTPIDSDLVKPKRVKESPFQMECKLHQMVHLGEGGGAGNLAICEIVKFHIAKDILDEKNRIDQTKIDLVGRNGGSYYTRSHGDALFEIAKPLSMMGMGFDGLPDFMKKSDIYTGSNLAQFATLDQIPAKDEIKKFIEEYKSKMQKAVAANSIEISLEAFKRYQEEKNYHFMFLALLGLKEKLDQNKIKHLLELTAKTALEAKNYDAAWKIAMSA